MVSAVGVLKDSKPIDVKCIGEGCESDHRTYDCRDVLFLMEGAALEDVMEVDALAACLDDGRMAATEKNAYPTMLGIWWEAVCDN